MSKEVDSHHNLPRRTFHPFPSTVKQPARPVGVNRLVGGIVVLRDVVVFERLFGGDAAVRVVYQDLVQEIDC